MANQDKKRKGSAKAKNLAKYVNNERHNFNRYRKEMQNLRKNPRDFDALKRCQALSSLQFIGKGKIEGKMNEAIQASLKVYISENS